MELEGIEPSSTEHESGLLRPFPSLRLAAAASPGRADLHWDPAAGAFSGVSGLCRLSAGLSPLSTAASGAGLQRSGPACHCWSQCLSASLITFQAARARASLSASLGCPVWRVWATLVATVDSSGLRRNLAAPSWLVVAGVGLEPHVLRLMRGAYIPSLDSVILAGALVAGQSRWRAQRVRASG